MSNTCSHHDEVISPFFIRLVDHFDYQDLKSDFFDSRLEGSTLSRTDDRCATPEVPCGPSRCREPRPSAPDLAADHQLGGSGDLPGLARCNIVRNTAYTWLQNDLKGRSSG